MFDFKIDFPRITGNKWI